MGHDNTVRWGALRAAVAALAALAALLLVFAATANAAPFHARNHSLDLEGLKHACGTAVDSKGDFYASNEGKEVKVYNPSHT
ncbi:MAG TPA: hypothetical protein VFJ64_11885, partial [Solirubrobacterales bacterium]|nr:hypothetical protein [Solirubrobacterales bacterium]